MDPQRSYAHITHADLRRLARLALEDRDDYFSRHPEFGLLYRKRLLAVALGEDAALHYLNGATGVREFSVWSFYAEHPEAPFPFYRVSRVDFGKPKFGRPADAPEAYVGRRVELHARSIDAAPADDPVAALQHYLQEGASRSARALAHKAMVLIAPAGHLGAQIWPTLALSRR